MRRPWSIAAAFVASAFLASFVSSVGCGAPKEGSGFAPVDSGATGSSSGSGSGSSSGSGSGSTSGSSSGGSSGGSSGAPASSGSFGDGGFVDASTNTKPDPDGGVACPSGLMCNVTCPGNGTTSITGKVYDPAGKNPLYGVAVYVPGTPLQPLPTGVPTGADACSCAALFKSGALTSTTSDVDGSFTLTNVPVGASVPLVLQVGKWRRSLHVAVTSCQSNAQPDKSLTLPGTVAAGTDDNMPDIAVSTGAKDTLECLLRRIGLPSSEYVAGTAAGGHVHVFTGGSANGSNGSGTQEGNPMPGAPPSDTSLWASQAQLMPYDITLLSCEGGEPYDAKPQVLEQYLNAGGRVFASHFHYAWFSGPIQSSQSYTAPADWGTNLATWAGGNNNSKGEIGAVIDTTLNGSTMPFPKGVALQKWLTGVGALGRNGVPAGELSIYSPRYNAVVASANKASQAWITSDTTADKPNQTMYFSFDTPVNAPPSPDGGAPPYCGRAVFSDLHVSGDPSTSGDNSSSPPPAGCVDVDLSSQEKALEFMLFDLSSCVIPDTVQPPVIVPPPPPPVQ